MSHLVRKTRSGEIVRWPICEASITVTPAEPRTLAVPVVLSTFVQQLLLSVLLAPCVCYVLQLAVKHGHGRQDKRQSDGTL